MGDNTNPTSLLEGNRSGHHNTELKMVHCVASKLSKYVLL